MCFLFLSAWIDVPNSFVLFFGEVVKRRNNNEKPLGVVGIVEGYFRIIDIFQWRIRKGSPIFLGGQHVWKATRVEFRFKISLFSSLSFFETKSVHSSILHSYGKHPVLGAHSYAVFNRTFLSHSPKHSSNRKNPAKALCVLESTGIGLFLLSPLLMGKKGKMFWMAFGDTIPILSVKNQWGDGP